MYNPNELYKTQKRLLHISMCELFTFQKKSTNSPKINEFNTKIQKFVSSTKKNNTNQPLKARFCLIYCCDGIKDLHM